MPTPASPMIVTRCGSPRSTARAVGGLQELDLAARGRRTPRRRPPTPRGRISVRARTSSAADDALFLPLRLDVLRLAEFERAPRRRDRALARPGSRPGCGGLLQPGRHVDRVAGHERARLAGRPTTTSPVLTPMRSRSRPESSRAGAALPARRAARARRDPRARPGRRTRLTRRRRTSRRVPPADSFSAASRRRSARGLASPFRVLHPGSVDPTRSAKTPSRSSVLRRGAPPWRDGGTAAGQHRAPAERSLGGAQVSGLSPRRRTLCR